MTLVCRELQGGLLMAQVQYPYIQETQKWLGSNKLGRK